MINGNAPSPRMPKVSRVASVEQLLPTAREMVSRTAATMYEGIEVKKGQKVLVVNDTTADQLVVQALATAILERGAHVDTITLEGFRGLTDAGEMVDSMFSSNWYPQWVWDAANQADIVLITAFLKAPHTPLPRLLNDPVVQNVEITADLMLSEYETFPVELRDTIDEVTWEKLFNCAEVKWTDLEGTDLTISLTAEDWKRAVESELKKTGSPYIHGHLMLPAPSTRMKGVWVISSVTFGGPVPGTTMFVENGKVVKVEGGGAFGDRLRESFARYGSLSQSTCPGPGVNWITTIGLCTNPKARRSPFFDDLEGSARVYAWTFGHRRSGVMHTSVGEGMVSSTYKVIRHMNTYFNTVVTDKGIVIENGHLTALDDPRVRQVALNYGDPDELLKETWIPAVSGVNAH
ncbi:MAG: hypothetical protein HY695_26930 [Deltaproteobacteria bacterium]|nr:hypothetical protein [Deltaproteobacteria bacterium]